MRLRGGFGTPCDPLHSGFVEIFHDGEWGRVCLEAFDYNQEPDDRLVADVACRQLGFPHGTLVIPSEGESRDSCAQHSYAIDTYRHIYRCRDDVCYLNTNHHLDTRTMCFSTEPRVHTFSAALAVHRPFYSL